MAANDPGSGGSVITPVPIVAKDLLPLIATDSDAVKRPTATLVELHSGLMLRLLSQRMIPFIYVQI
jgi:hypothetical protein